MDTLKIGKYIQYLRKTAGMTQKELAEKLGISFQSVSKWENGGSLRGGFRRPEPFSFAQSHAFARNCLISGTP